MMDDPLFLLTAIISLCAVLAGGWLGSIRTPRVIPRMHEVEAWAGAFGSIATGAFVASAAVFLT